MGYCETTDLLLSGDLPLPQGVSRQSYVDLASDEIDMMISRYYKTPVVFGTTAEQEKYKSTMLLLKHINIKLATGRLILAIDASGEDRAVHAYGSSLVLDAMKLIQAIVDRDIVLEGASGNTNEPNEIVTARASVFQLDPTSGVEDFYNMAQQDYSQLVGRWGISGG